MRIHLKLPSPFIPLAEHKTLSGIAPLVETTQVRMEGEVHIAFNVKEF